MNTKDKTYDHIGDFHQGIAIVKKDGKFGAIMIGGKEIIQPIYEALSDFNDGLATAMFNGEERTINMLGQILVKKEGDEIFLPEEYDWGYDFIGGSSVVFKNGQGYGMISCSYEIILELVYSSFSRLKNGAMVFYGHYKSRFVHIDGEIHFIHQNVSDECFVISDKPYDGRLGVANKSGDIVIPMEYSRINVINNAYIVADTDSKVTRLFNVKGKLLRSTNNTTIYKSFNKELVYFEHFNEKILINTDGKFFTQSIGIASQPIEISEDYLNYQHEWTGFSFLKIKNDTHLWGISDKQGNIIIPAKYNYISPISKERFIAAIVSEEKILKFGIVDVNDRFLLPFKYSCLENLSNGYIVYSLDYNIKYNEKNSYLLKSTLRSHCNYEIYTSINISWGIINPMLSEICLPKYNIIENITLNLEQELFIVGIGDRTRNYGIIDDNGREITPIKFRNIELKYPEKTIIVKPNHVTSDFYCNILNDKGCFVVRASDSEDIFVPADMVDWCSNFNGPYARVLINGVEGKINKQGKLISLLNDRIVEVPLQYKLAEDFHFGFSAVMKKKKWGIANENFDLVIPCEYEYIEPIGNDCFRYKVTKNSECKYGLVDIHNNQIVDAEYENVEFLEGGFFKLSRRFPAEPLFYRGVVDKKGNIIIPVVYTDIIATNIADKNYLIVINEYKDPLDYWGRTIVKKGVYCDDINIIPVIFTEITPEDVFFICKVENNVVKYNANGEIVLKYNDSEFIIPNDYNLALESSVGVGLFRVMKDGKWGVLNLQKDLVVPNIYSYIYDYVGCYAVVEKGDYVCYFGEDPRSSVNVKMGLINTLGEEALPLEYEDLWIHDNGYIVASKDGVYGILSPSLNWIITPQYYRITMLGNTHFMAVVDGENKLFDYSGHEIPLEDFDEIEITSNGFYKLTRYYYNSKCLVNFQGKIIASYDLGYEDFEYLDNGVILVSQRESQGINLRDKTVYNLINLQGKELFSIDYEEIKFLKKSILVIRKEGKWGLADISGNIIVDPVYEYELNFDEDNTSEIQVVGSSYTQRLKLNGQIFVSNGAEKILLPQSLYWGSDFVNGFCIVRSKGQYSIDYVGVINIKGEIIIPTQYQEINILSNNVIVAKNSKGLWGVFNDCGSIIMDFVYDLIEPQEDSFYALVKKGQIYGIANLETNEIVLFEKYGVKHLWNLDRYGRCLYSKYAYVRGGEPCEGGNIGLIDMNGIMVPADEYQEIYSLKEDVVVTINENGEDEYYEKYGDGEWRVVNKDEIIIDDENNTCFSGPSVIILSDEIPKSRSNNYSNWYYYDNDYDSYSKYGGYNDYDDDTIDSAFEGDPEATWNID